MTKAGEHLRYGQVKGPAVKIGGLIWAASQVIGNQSGKFVYMNDGALTLNVASVNYIFGWAMDYARTPTVGDKCTVNVSREAVYRIPINNGTFVIGMIGDMCDLSVATNSNYGANTQGADLAAYGEGVVMIVGGDLVDNKWVDVMLSSVPPNAQQTINT